ncbi:MAG: chromate efflux transporter [Hydrogenibacillus sp.]|nr:chromate efflux transporter [Hydrogenibacillus sp.]
MFRTAVGLGLTSFGGPTAHLGYFHRTYVERKKWLDDAAYADLVALAQFLPGPASSQVGMAIGIARGGMIGGLLAWIGFTLPSAWVMIVFAAYIRDISFSGAAWLHGLKLVAAAVVAQAVYTMAGRLAPDRPRATIAVLSAALSLLWPAAGSQAVIIVLAALIAFIRYRKDLPEEGPAAFSVGIGRRTGIIALLFFFALLLLMPLLETRLASALAPLLPETFLPLFNRFYRVGSLVFGGGHVVLPLLEREVVPTGWVRTDDFLAGYGLAQAIPGPLFAFAGFLGQLIAGLPGAIVALLAIFLPGALLIVGVLPFWSAVRRSRPARAALRGAGAAVVGLLFAALYDPLWTHTVASAIDVVIVSVLYLLLHVWRVPPVVVVLAGALLAEGSAMMR